MAYSSIVKPTDYFNTNLWTGNGSSQSISGLDFAPDWVWIKQRSGTRYHNLQDTIRGTGLQLFSNTTGADNTDSTNITAFNSDGYSLGAGQNVNNSSSTYVGWSWLAGGSASSNSNGSITSSVSANTTSGFSIVSYTGTGSNATVGHGLGAAPSYIIIKDRDNSRSWIVGSDDIGWGNYVSLDATDASASLSSIWNSTAPTSTVFSVGTAANTNNSGSKLIAYCFAEKKGYSKIGSYTGNGNADGPFIYTGFKPAFLIMKPYSKVEEWTLLDNKRLGYNPDNNYVYPNQDYAEMTADRLDILSNGFKLRSATGELNTSSATMFYLAIAENPFVANDSGTAVPVVAR